MASGRADDGQAPEWIVGLGGRLKRARRAEARAAEAQRAAEASRLEAAEAQRELANERSPTVMIARWVSAVASALQA